MLSERDVKKWISRSAGMYENDELQKMSYGALLGYLFRNRANEYACGARVAGILADILDKRDATSQSADVQQWLPIESAPKDGTRILIACQFEDGRINCVCDGFWNTMQDRWEDIEDAMPQDRASLWMPLPKPPFNDGEVK